MDTSNELTNLIIVLLLAAPGFLIKIAGIGFSLVKFSRFPKTSAVAIIALLISLLLGIAATAFPYFSNFFLSMWSTQEFSYFLYFFNITTSLANTFVLLLLVIAVWLERTPKEAS